MQVFAIKLQNYSKFHLTHQKFFVPLSQSVACWRWLFAVLFPLRRASTPTTARLPLFLFSNGTGTASTNEQKFLLSNPFPFARLLGIRPKNFSAGRRDYFSISKINNSINSKKSFLYDSFRSESPQIFFISSLSISILIFSSFSLLTFFTTDFLCSSV